MIEYVHIDTFADVTRANLICAMMRARDMRVRLKDEHIVSVNPLYNTAVGGVKLMAHPEDAEHCVAYLNEIKNGDAADA